jgi:hypothetical protein
VILRNLANRRPAPIRPQDREINDLTNISLLSSIGVLTFIEAFGLRFNTKPSIAMVKTALP